MSCPCSSSAGGPAYGSTLYFPAGTSARFRFTARQFATGQPLDLTGGSLALYLKTAETVADADAALTATTANGKLVIMDALLGLFDWIIAPGDTSPTAYTSGAPWFRYVKFTNADGEVYVLAGSAGDVVLDAVTPAVGNAGQQIAYAPTVTAEAIGPESSPVPAYATIAYVDDLDAAQTADLAAHTARTDNPHAVTKAQIGLGNVPNVDATNASNLSSGTLPATRLPAFTGDASSSAGSSSLTLATVATPGTYNSVTVDAKGRVTAGTNPTTLAGYGITDGVKTDMTNAAAATTSAQGAVTLAGSTSAVTGTSTSLVTSVDDAARLGLAAFAGYGLGNRLDIGNLPSPDLAKVISRYFAETPNGLNAALGLTIGDRRNIWQYTETLSNAAYGTVNASKGTDTVVVNGITLTKFTSTNFYGELFSVPSGLTVGAYYLLSCFVLSAQDHEQWPAGKSPTNDNNNHFRRKLLVPGRLRRIWHLVRAVTSSTVDLGGIGSTAYGSGSAGNYSWFISGGYPDGSSGAANSIVVYVGGFQIEQVTSDGKNGIAFIGDSTTQGASGGTDNSTSLEWPVQIGAHLNVDAFNRGVSGNQTSQMDSRWATDITPLKNRCKYVVIQPSAANDIPNGVSLATTQAAVNSMITKAAADSLIAVLVVPPSTAAINANSGYKTTYDSLCAWIRQTFPLVIDNAKICNDPLNPYILRRAANWEGDGTHFGSGAKRAIALNAAAYPWWDFPRPSPYQPIAATTYTAPSFQLWDSATNTIKAVSLGANDSGGTGYKLLRVAN